MAGNPNRESGVSATEPVGAAVCGGGGGSWDAHRNRPHRPSPAAAASGGGGDGGGLPEDRDDHSLLGGDGCSPANVPAASSRASLGSRAGCHCTGPCALEAAAGDGRGDGAAGDEAAKALLGSHRPALHRCPSTTCLSTSGTPRLHR